MAQDWRFQNGLYLESPSETLGNAAVCRWLYEFATQICGWAAYDNNDAKWTAVNGSGVSGASVVGAVDRFEVTGDAYNFVHATDAGRYLTITGMTGANRFRNGIYRILSVISSKVVVLDIKRGVHEEGIPLAQSGLTWRLWTGIVAGVTLPAASTWAVMRGAYRVASGNFDILLTAGLAGYLEPQFTLSPYATWDAGANAWAAGPPGPTTQSVTFTVGYTQKISRVWAVGDQNVIMVSWIPTNPGYGQFVHHFYLGEITPNYPAVDPKPSIIAYGGSNNIDAVIGAGATGQTGGSLWTLGGGRMLAADQLTSLPVYLSIPTCLATDGTNRLAGLLNRWSARTKKFYRHEVTALSIAASNNEWRGRLIGLQACGAANVRAMPFGASLEYLHTFGGIVFPWNGSKSHVQI